MMAHVTAVVSHPFNCNAKLLFDIYLSFPEEQMLFIQENKMVKNEIVQLILFWHSQDANDVRCNVTWTLYRKQ